MYTNGDMHVQHLPHCPTGRLGFQLKTEHAGRACTIPEHFASTVNLLHRIPPGF